MATKPERRLGRGRLVLALCLVLPFVAVAPATAGSPDDPDLTDACGELGTPGQQMWVVPGWADICAGWFETLSEPPGPVDPEEPPEIRFTLRLAEDVADRTATLYAVHWQSGGCRYVAMHEDEDALAPARLQLHVQCSPWVPPDCPGPVPVLCVDRNEREVVDLPAGAWAEDGDRVSWTLRFDGALADFADDHRHGRVLGGLQAHTSLRAGPRYLFTFGCVSGDDPVPTHCDQIGGNLAADGRPYTVGT